MHVVYRTLYNLKRINVRNEQRATLSMGLNNKH